ncbi:maltose ABC transporter substrate-binding protein [Nonomuraea sp. NPDC050404]|uniref:sugar ABC transporter substrate-binding protein n=1 Tax=Nonomuraea sp. NPDC050404 TaxID=3155783 RepID=UPI0033F99373
MIWADNNRATVLQRFADAFAKENGVKVAVQVSTDVRRDFGAAAQTGSGPDVIVGAHDWLGEFVQNNAVSPLSLSGDLVAGFLPSAIAAATLNEQIYGVPYAVENIALVRNTALAPEAPETLAELVESGLALVKSGKATNALLVPVGKGGDSYFAYPFLSAFGGGFFGQKANGEYDPGKVIVNSDTSIKGAEVLAEIGKKKVLSTNVDGTNIDALFNAGKAPYYFTGPWAIETAKKAGIKYAISPLPSIEGGGRMLPFLGVQMFYVSANTKNKTLAEEFVINQMASTEVQEALFVVGNRPPALKEAYEKVAAGNADVKAWFEAGVGAKPIPNISAVRAVWGPVAQAEADVIAGKSSPRAAFDAAQKQVVEGIKKG